MKRKPFDPLKPSTFPVILYGSVMKHVRSGEEFLFKGYFKTLDPEIWYAALGGWGDHMRLLCEVSQFVDGRFEKKHTPHWKAF